MTITYSWEYDGTNYFVTLNGKKIGPGRTRVECGEHIKWLRAGGLRDVFDFHNDMIDKMFKDKEKRNG